MALHPTESFSVSALARELEVPRATCDTVLMGLAEGGLVVRRDDDLRYELGPSCIALGDAAASRTRCCAPRASRRSSSLAP